MSPADQTRHPLNLLAGLAGRVDDPAFMQDWLAASNEQEIEEALLQDERFLSNAPGRGRSPHDRRHARVHPGAP